MKRVLTASVLATATTLAQATPLYHPPGPNLTNGAVSNGQSSMSDITNPAAGAAVLKTNGNQYRFGVLSSIGGGAEFGKVDDLYDKVNTQAQDAFQNGQNVNINVITATGTDIDNAINGTIADINNILKEVSSDDGYAKLFASAHAPVMPVVVAHQALGGSLVLDFNGSFSTKIHALQATIQDTGFGAAIQADVLDNGIIDGTYNNGETSVDLTDPTNPVITINNDSSVIISAATQTELAFGYSRPVTELAGGTLYGGLRGRYHKIGKARAAIRLGSLDDAEQAFKDAMDSDFVEKSALGLDAGVLWVNDNYRLGATVANINEPTFDFGDVSNISSYGTEIGKLIRETNKYTMERQITLEGALYTQDQMLVLSGAFDTNAIADALGDEYQWATLSAAFNFDNWLVPGLRIGIRKNMAGTNIQYLSAGMTLFKVLNLDYAQSSDTVTIDGTTVPRGFIANLGLELTF